jgi:aldehyde:ferredoxin oxidoreductase
MGVTALAQKRYGHLGQVLFVDLGERSHRVEAIDESVYRSFLGGYGLGAWLLWKHFPPGTDPLAPEACFAICSGLLTGLRTPFSGRIQIVGKSPLTGTWADSNSGGSVCSHLRQAGYDAVVVRGRAAEPTVLVIRDGEVTFEPAGELWGQEIPETFDSLKAQFGGKRDVGVSAIGPAGEQQLRIAAVMNDRYHAFGLGRDRLRQPRALPPEGHGRHGDRLVLDHRRASRGRRSGRPLLRDRPAAPRPRGRQGLL